MSNHSSRTLNMMRKMAFHGDVVERWVPFGANGGAGRSLSGVRKDYCGFADLIAYGHSRIIALQVCNGTTIKPHMDKIATLQHAIDWVRNGGELWIVAWRKIGKPKRFAPRWFVAQLADDLRKLDFVEVERITP